MLIPGNVRSVFYNVIRHQIQHFEEAYKDITSFYAAPEIEKAERS